MKKIRNETANGRGSTTHAKRRSQGWGGGGGEGGESNEMDKQSARTERERGRSKRRQLKEDECRGRHTAHYSTFLIFQFFECSPWCGLEHASLMCSHCTWAVDVDSFAWIGDKYCAITQQNEEWLSA